MFAFCLVPYTAATTLTSALVFGSRDATNALGLVYTPLLQGTSPSFYWVGMVGVSVAGVDAGIPTALFASTDGVLFDSGTPLTYFAPEIYDPLHQSIAGAIPYPVAPDPVDAVVAKPLNRLCFDLAGVQSPVLPTMAYHFTDADAAGATVDFDLGLENIYMNDMNTVWCLAIVRGESGNPSIVGNIQQANHYIEHDVALNRIGWTSKDCTV